MQFELVPLVAALAGGLIGGWVTHFFATRRDIAAKRREIILTNLLAALEDLDRSNTNRDDADLKALERVVFKVQVFGDSKLIELAKLVTDDFVGTGSADTTALIVALRDYVRAELKLSPLASGYRYLTISPGKSDGSASHLGAKKK